MGKVEVYWNLHKGCFSVRSCKTGRVIIHTAAVNIRDAKFVVRQAGRRKVLQEKKKNVHAFVRGYLTPMGYPLEDIIDHGYATYNPYKYDSFVDAKTKESLDTAKFVSLYTHKRDKKGAIQWLK